MNYQFYKGTSLRIPFKTALPDLGGVRKRIIDFKIAVKAQGYVAEIINIDDYSFNAVFSAVSTLKFQEGAVDVVLYLTKDNNTSIGKLTGLFCVHPQEGEEIPVQTSPIEDGITVNDIDVVVSLNNLFTYQDLSQSEKLEMIAEIAQEADQLFSTLTLSVNNKLSDVDQYILNVEEQVEVLQRQVISSESARASAEQTRATAESSRSSAESARASAEQTRATAESSRSSAESARASAEQTRSNQEATRQQNESARASAEQTRATAESSRSSAESARASAEQTRATAESSRSSAESARASAEESRNVASNVYNITIAVPLAAGAFYTATTARAAVPTAVRKRGLELIYETSAGVWYRERFIGASTTTWTTATDWELVPTKGYVDTGINNALGMLSENWVGVIVDPTLSSSEASPKSTVVAYRATELKRTGNLNYHKAGKSRIFNAFYPAIVNRATKQVAWRLNKNNPSLKEDGSPSVPDWTIHNVCIVIPNLYRRIVLLDGNADGKYEIRYDIAPFEGASLFHAESYHSIGEAQLDRTETKLVSVISDDVRFRGGGNQSAWDAQAWRSQLGMPLTDTSRINFELYANNAGWQTMNIYDHTLYSELAMLYFANTNIQLDYTSLLTPDGYPQGGLGAGNSNWAAKRWVEKNSYYPLDKVGQAFMSVGCNVGVYAKTDNNYYVGAVTAVTAGKLVSTGNFSAAAGWLATYVGYTIRNLITSATATIIAKDDDNILSLSDDIFTAVGQIFQIEGVSISYGIPVFFGLENLYGHLWKHCSGINFVVQAADAGGKSIAYVNPDWATRSASDVTAYQQVGEIPRVDGYIKTLYPGWNIVKNNAGAGSNTFMSDYGYHANLPSSGSVIRCLLVSGSALPGAPAGLRLALSSYAPSYAFAVLGARLRALTR